MKVNKKPLNDGECFACNVAYAKNFFKDIDGQLNFAYYGRDFSAFNHTPRYYFLKNKIKGRIIASALVYPQGELIIDFYAIKIGTYTNEIKTKFEKTILPNIISLYKEKTSNQSVIRTVTELIIELENTELIIHKIETSINE